MKRQPLFLGARRASWHSQRGVSLIEILVGLMIGLLIIGVALGAVLVSRQITSTLNESVRLQQQAAYALRIIGQQVRQAGSMRLDLAYGRPDTESAPIVIDPAEPVAFDATFNRASTMLDSSATHPLQTRYAFYKERLAQDPKKLIEQMRDCLGSAPEHSAVENAFFLKKGEGADANAIGELSCRGSRAAEGAQALIGDIADFQVTWLRQRQVGSDPVIDRVNAATAKSNWSAIQAVEVCIEMLGTQTIETGQSTYRPCHWSAGAKETLRGNRLRLVYRNTFQLRTQGGLQ